MLNVGDRVVLKADLEAAKKTQGTGVNQAVREYSVVGAGDPLNLEFVNGNAKQTLVVEAALVSPAKVAK